MQHRTAYFITAMGTDQPGRMAHLGQRLGELEGQIADLSQTVMRGQFTVIALAWFPVGVTAELVRARLTADVPDLVIGVQAAGQPPADRPGQRLILTARGADQPGLIGGVSSFLAGRDINIDDMYARLDESGDGFQMIVQMRCPAERDLRELQLDLAELADDLGIVVHLQHENVFRATCEIGAVRGLTL
ncbi:MAG: hypothetical protein IT204_25535 [Fimbriimonadaceae bacterium]|nr:hypothetical protein [Fimbriimonadaceae bacterium]